MKKDNRGFFLAETIIVLTLVTTVMAFVYPNVTKLYENYKLQVMYYDQPEDIYALKAIYEVKKEIIDEETISGTKKGCKIFNNNEWTEIAITDLALPSIDSSNSDIYLTGYMTDITLDSSDFNFHRYLKRMKKTTFEPYSYRLIGKFKIDHDSDPDTDKITRYSSIKIYNPNPEGICS